MPHVTYKQPGGTETVIDVASGMSVMQGALSNGVPGISAECGGALSCATCHVYVDEAWLGRLPPPTGDETDMLDCTASERRPNSRLSCQITMRPEFDGLAVRVPDAQ